MRLPAVLFLMSMGFAGFGVVLPALADYMPIAGAAAIASLLLLLGAWRRLRRGRRGRAIIDGSNVMHWQDNTPRLEVLRAVLRMVQAQGWEAGVVLDANVGYKLFGGYRGAQSVARTLGLPVDNVIVVPKGQIADLTILEAARQLDARIITNDRYREWSSDFPEVARPGWLIRGGYRDGTAWLEADEGQGATGGPVRTAGGRE